MARKKFRPRMPGPDVANAVAICASSFIAAVLAKRLFLRTKSCVCSSAPFDTLCRAVLPQLLSTMLLPIALPKASTLICVTLIRPPRITALCGSG